MNQILRCVLVFFIAAMVNFSVANSTVPDMNDTFFQFGIMPNIVKRGPSLPTYVNYRSGAIVKEGNELIPAMVNDVPTVTWQADPVHYYTLAMLGADAPAVSNPSESEWQHWLVVNILGKNVTAGDTLAAYDPPRPLEGTGLHRYVFLVYKQPGRLEFNEPRLSYSDTSSDDRARFCISKFAKKYGLNDPVAGNLFVAQFKI